MKLTFLKLAEQIFKEVRKPMDVVEIWSYAEKHGLNKELKSIGKTPWRSIGAQIYVNMRDDKNTIFYQYSSRPAKFFLKEFQNEAPKEIEEEASDEIEILNIKCSFHERDLHPLIVKFVNSDTHFRAHVKTIYHENSKRKKSGFNEWLHPDLVGVYYPDFDKNALELQKTLSLSSIKLFSFELKIRIDWSNLRQCFFQAVSNSSWCHEGYLVVLNIKEDDEFIDELRRLNNAFGIGVIKLNLENIYQSEILFPAITKEDLDWDTINRLILENKDFNNFIETITKDTLFHNKYNEINKEHYDKVLSDDEFDEYIKRKQIKSEDKI